MVLTAIWAAAASCSWFEAAPATSVFVSSTSALAVFRILSLERGNVLFNDALNTFYLRLYGVRHMVKDHSDSYSFRLTARVLIYASSHRQESTYHSLCYTSRGALAGMRNSSMGPPHEGLIQRPIAQHERTLLPRSYISFHSL